MIDINAFAGPWPFRALPATLPADVATMLQEAGIARALVSPLEALFFEDPHIANERLAARLQPDGILLPCAAINPTLANWARSLRSAQEEIGARAVVLHPNYHCYDLESDPARALLAAAGEAGLPVIIQLRMQDLRSQHPLCKVPDVSVGKAVNAAEAAPGTRVILGGIRFAEVSAQAARIRALSNVWIELSQVENVDGVRQAITAVGANRIVLGTGAPLFNVRSSLLKLEEGQLSNQERAAITRQNARELLAI